MGASPPKDLAPAATAVARRQRVARRRISRPSAMGAPEPASPPEAASPGVSRDEFRNAMARLGSAVTVVTTDGTGGRAGFTASAVCSVSDTPPTLLVCLNRGASVYATFAANLSLCVNILADEQEEIALLFGGKTPMPDRFAAAEWSALATGAPLMNGALACFDCQVTKIVESGTHDVMICAVLAVRSRLTGDGLVYFDRRFHAVPGQD